MQLPAISPWPQSSHCRQAKSIVLSRMDVMIFPLLLLLPFLCHLHVVQSLDTLISGAASGHGTQCDRNDVSALLDFKDNVGGSILNTWNPNVSCCNWVGVTCDGSIENPRVLNLSLQAKGLNGVIPPSLGNLSALQACNLSYNSLHGFIPKELASLSQLTLLDLSNNNLSGSVVLLENLHNLQAVNVSSNFFVGNLPSLRNMSSLVHFCFSNNTLNGSVPTDACQYAQGIRIFSLALNKFTGSLEEGFGNCVHLEVLDLGSNQLDGHIPSNLFKLRSLTDLCLAHNLFSGTLDAGVGNLVNLASLSLGFNNLEGPLPQNLSACIKLKILTANSNHFEGQITVNFSNMLELEMVDLDSNKFSGSIPASLVECTALQSLNMAKNELTGEIPSGFNRLRNLSSLSLSSNHLNGSLRSLTDTVQLVSLILSKNVFTEMLPESVSGLTNLQVLALGNLNLSGMIPGWLTNCTKLQVLDLSWNHLHGPLPRWLGSFQHLFYMDLSNNSFEGSIPPELFNLPTPALGDDNQTGLQLVVSNLAIKRNIGYPELQYTQVSAFPSTLSLSHNLLTGPIPSQVGNFKLLLILDLSVNYLSGSIPESLANMTDIESLDLSRNSLTGPIPSSLARLTFLSFFNVSNNQLSGSVPLGNQFSTFTNKSYEGNAGLCGAPLAACTSNGNVEPALASMRSRGPFSVRIAILVPTGLVICLTAALVAALTWKLSRRNVVYQGNVSFREMDGPRCLEEALNSSVEMFHSHGKLTVSDLFKATNHFDQANIVGCGGFGLVYRADLGDGSRLAIKKLTGDCGQMEREFRAEVEALSKAQHRNLVSLQGYLQVGNDRLLLYSYMENGSLDYWLHERSDGGFCLDWPMRLQIAQGAAHGLAYLHQICNPHIVHRDIKSSNILLDEKFEAHLADFGLARLMMSTDTHVTTELVGTLGYIPPEYCQALNATLRGDVYSFGVVLLELLTRKRPVDVCKARGHGDLVAWVSQWRVNGKPEEIFDSAIRNKGNEEQMLQVLDVAWPCINPDPLKRPTVRDIVVWLDQIGQDNVSSKPFS